MTHDENTEFEERSRGSKKPTLGPMQIYSKFDGFPLTFVHCLGLCLVMTPANTGSNYGGDVHEINEGVSLERTSTDCKTLCPWTMGLGHPSGDRKVKNGIELVEK